MTSRDTDEEHRASTPLELLFDLCFVVAVSRAAALLHHAIAAGDAGSAVVSYVLVFFAIWWAWMNFTWFSSAYDNDDVVYRLLTLVQITGVLILAAGVPRAFEHRDFDIVFVGYLVIRAGLVSLWLRAGRYDRALYPRLQRQFTESDPRIRLEFLERSGSFSHVEEPEAVFALVREFTGQ